MMMNFFARLQNFDFDPLHYTNLRSLVDYCVLTIARKIDYLIKLSHDNLKSSVILPNEVLIKIVHLLIKRRKLSDESLSFLLNPFITTLDLTNSQITNIPLIGEKCPNLSILCLRGCLTVSDSSLFQISNCCKSLIGLSLMYNRKITDKGIEKLAENCTKLQSLDLSWCSRISNHCLEKLALNCVHLEEVSVACCKLITETGIEVLIQNCKKLIRMELRSCTSIKRIEVPSSSSLKELDLSHCTSLENETMESISSSLSLRSLDCDSCPKLTDYGVAKLIQSSELVSLSFSNCNFETLHFQTPNLIILNLSCCKNLSLSTFQSLALCSSLTELHLRACVSITDEYIRVLTSSYLPNSLTYLDLSRCHLITHDSVSSIFQKYFYLRSLDISWCPQINDLAFTCISKSLHKLPQIELIKAFGCNISGFAAQQLKLKIKQLNIKLNLQCIMNERDWSTMEAI